MGILCAIVEPTTNLVPLGGNTAALLGAYLAEHGLDKPGHERMSESSVRV